jgi:hypothetical protein
MLSLLSLPGRAKAARRRESTAETTPPWTVLSRTGRVTTLRSGGEAQVAPGRPARTPGPAAPVVADLTSRFDVTTGRLLEIRGTVVRRGRLKVSSTVVLSRL